MTFIGSLMKKEENADTKEEAGASIKKSGMLLEDDMLDAVSGGGSMIPDSFALYDSICSKNDGGGHNWTAIKGLYICMNCKNICKDKRA